MEIKLDKDYMLNELDLPDRAIFDEIDGTSIWSIEHRIIFEYQGKFYQTYYSVGATESQYESPWQDEDEVECHEVELKEVTVKKWVLK